MVRSIHWSTPAVGEACSREVNGGGNLVGRLGEVEQTLDLARAAAKHQAVALSVRGLLRPKDRPEPGSNPETSDWPCLEDRLTGIGKEPPARGVVKQALRWI